MDEKCYENWILCGANINIRIYDMVWYFLYVIIYDVVGYFPYMITTF